MRATRMLRPGAWVLASAVLLTACETSPIAQVKEGVLTDYPTAKVGDAFDAYDACRKTAWEHLTTDRGEELVEYACTFDVPAMTPKVEEDIASRCREMAALASVGMGPNPGASCVQDLTTRVNGLHQRGADMVVQFAILKTGDGQFTVKGAGFRDLDGAEIGLGPMGELSKAAILPRIYGADPATWGTFSAEEFLRRVVEGWRPGTGEAATAGVNTAAAPAEQTEEVERLLKSDLRNAMTAQEIYFTDHSEYAGQDAIAASWQPSSGVEITAFDATNDGYRIGLRQGSVQCSVTYSATAESEANGVPTCQ